LDGFEVAVDVEGDGGGFALSLEVQGDTCNNTFDDIGA